MEEILERLPPRAVVLGDRNFGIFSVAWAAQQQQHPVLFRLTNARAGKLLGRALQPGIDGAVVWSPSRDERRAHPAYNLVRTVMCLAARKAGLSPRQLSFTSVYTLIETHLSTLLRAHSRQSWRREMDKLVDYAAAYKLPQRSKRRSYPRAIWGSGYRFPVRTAHDKTKWVPKRIRFPRAASDGRRGLHP